MGAEEGGLTEAEAGPFQSLGNGDFLVPLEKPYGAHLTEVEAERVVRATALIRLLGGAGGLRSGGREIIVVQVEVRIILGLVVETILVHFIQVAGNSHPGCAPAGRG